MYMTTEALDNLYLVTLESKTKVKCTSNLFNCSYRELLFRSVVEGFIFGSIITYGV